MFGAHLAAGLALKGAEPRAPAWALLTGAFLPDLAWIALAGAGIEPTATGAFYDGWSHSVLSIVVLAGCWVLAFRRLGARPALACGLAVLSHLPLDALIHPRPLELSPFSSATLPWDLWAWGRQRTLGFTRYWLVQSGAIAALLPIYVTRVRRTGVAWNLIAASCLTVIAAHCLI